jgi:hypothetical protein
MRRFSVSLLFLASACMFGQQAPHNSAGPEAARATTFQSNVSISDGCPVGLFVDRRSNLVTRLAEDGHPSGPAQGLHISLIHLFTRINSAKITVYGTSMESRVLPMSAAKSNEISKTFVLHPGEGRKGSQEATVWMHRVGAVTSVALNSLTYADGSVWRESESSRCRAVPSLFLLVDTK